MALAAFVGSLGWISMKAGRMITRIVLAFRGRRMDSGLSPVGSRCNIDPLVTIH